MSLINSKLCKFQIKYAIFFSIISGNTICVGDKNVSSILDACLHTAAQIRMVYIIPCTSSKSYYQLILIYNFEQKYFTTCFGGAKLLCTV